MEIEIKRCAAPLMLSVFLLACSLVPTWGQDRPFRSVVITNVEIGEIPQGNYALRATIMTVDPGADIPDHVHNYPGLRYMLEGALTIQWKDGGSQTFSAGSTFFERPGANHPPGVMAAANPLGVPARVLIIELVPDE